MNKEQDDLIEAIDNLRRKLKGTVVWDHLEDKARAALEAARADERAMISYQLGLVAGEGYKLHRALQDSCEDILLTSQTPEEVRDALIETVTQSKAFKFSEM